MLVDRAEHDGDRCPTPSGSIPNGDGAGFYRFALDDAALGAPRRRSCNRRSTAAERLALVGNQWALVKAGKVAVDQFFALLAGFRAETDRAVLAAITERLYWLSTHVVDDAARPAFERFAERFFRPQFDALGWDPRRGETADDRLRRATVIGALGELAGDADVVAEARRAPRALSRRSEQRSTRTSRRSWSASPRARGDAALYQRYLERKRARRQRPRGRAALPLRPHRVRGPELVAAHAGLTLTDEVRPQDRAHLFARLLGTRAVALTRPGSSSATAGTSSPRASIRCCSRTSSAASRSSRPNRWPSEVRDVPAAARHRRNARDRSARPSSSSASTPPSARRLDAGRHRRAARRSPERSDGAAR